MALKLEGEVMIVTQTRQKHALYTLKVGGQTLFFDPSDPVLPRSMLLRGIRIRLKLRAHVSESGMTFRFIVLR